MILTILLFCIFSFACQTFAVGSFKKGFLTPMYGTSMDGKGKSAVQMPNKMGNVSKIQNAIKISSAEDRKEAVKIRVIFREREGPAHAFVVVGFYEYDFVQKCARRRKFRSDIDRELDEFDAKKDQPFKGDGLFVKPSKTAQVFFGMSERFWSEESYSYNQANCLDYVFNFVCALFDGKCPPKNAWPNNFIEFDNNMIGSLSYFMPKHITSGGLREPQSVFERQPIALPERNDQNCVLKDHHLEMRIKNCRNNGAKCANFLLFHLTGRFDGPIWHREALKNRIFVQTKVDKSWQNGENGTIHLAVELKAYSCKIGEPKHWATFVTDLFVLDETTKHYVNMQKVCHNHNWSAINLDELTDHILEVEFDGWISLITQ